MSEIEKFLQGIVTMRRSIPTSSRRPYCCIEDFVLSRGRFMGDYHDTSNRMPKGKPRECFRNAYHMMSCTFRYCEGFAMGEVPVLHAWLVNWHGQVEDPTWTSGTEYFGVIFPAVYVIETFNLRKVHGVIDNHQDRWPLLRGEEFESFKTP